MGHEIDEFVNMAAPWGVGPEYFGHRYHLTEKKGAAATEEGAFRAFMLIPEGTKMQAWLLTRLIAGRSGANVDAGVM